MNSGPFGGTAIPRRRLAAAIAVAAGVVLAACGGGKRVSLTPTPFTTPTPSATATPTATPTPSATVTPTATPTPGPTATPVASARLVRLGDTSRPLVALTLDAGADVGYTEQILDTLERNGVRVSFGMTGVWALAHPDLVRRMVGDGHTLLDHSWGHPSFTGASTGQPPLTQAQRWAQLDRTEALLRELTGHGAAPYFRAPYGDTDASVERDIAARGFRYDVLWTVDSRGWAGAGVDEIVRRCVEGARPGAIIVMHVGGASRDGPALQRVIDGIRARGLGFATVPELVHD